jgi:hypothetical protein
MIYEMSTHTSTRKGTPVLCILKDGTRIEGKFKDKKSGVVHLEDGTKIKTKDLRAMTIRKLIEARDVHQPTDGD